MDDVGVVAAQIDRRPRSVVDVTLRCPLGLPVVISVPPLLDDGTPFPTSFWLTCPLAVRRIGRIEADGGVQAAEALIRADPGIAAAHDRAMVRYGDDRDALVPQDHEGPRPSGGVGGSRAGVKCLHAHYADHAAGNVNPIGAWVAPRVEPLNCTVPCAADVEGVVARNPEWVEPAFPGVIRAAVDIGTNTVRLLVVDAEGRDLERRYVVTRLGRGVDTSGTFRADSVAHTLDVLGEYRETIHRLGAATIRAVATSATRDVSDGGTFLDAAEGVLGLRPEVISGEEEATLSFQGAVSGGLGAPPTLVIDVGGGSTEFVYGREAPEYATSIDIGSVRLTERTLPDRPVIDDQLATARTRADGGLSAVALPGPVTTAIGVGGTFTSLATLAMDLPRDAWVHGARLSCDDVTMLVGVLAEMTIGETEQLSALDPARAPVILGGAIVVERAMVVAGLDAITVTEHDLLDGIVLSLSDR